MTINLHIPTRNENLKPTITVVGVGGAGGNAVNNMIASHLEGITFVVANTDAQALDNALTDRVIQLGANITQGLGAGASPDVGRASAEEAYDEIMAHIDGSHMVFITAGMGGGTGTGAAPIVARMARERGILTVAVVTKPFHFEGTHRMKLAEAGLEELQKYVDTMIVIPNQNLFRVANEKTTFADAFRMADEVLHSGVRGVTDLMIMPGLINLDFADIRAVMREMGKAMMGTGEAQGERRAIEAAEAAISNPLLDDVSMKGARGVLINITGGRDMTLFEVDEAANRIRDEVDPDANIIFGSTFNDALEGTMRISVVATGIDQQQFQQQRPNSGSTNNTGTTEGMRRFSQRAEASQPATYNNAPAAPSALRGNTSAFSRNAAPFAASSTEMENASTEHYSPMQQPETSHFAFAESRDTASMTAQAPTTASGNPAIASVREITRTGRHSPTRREAPQPAQEMQQSQHSAQPSRIADTPIEAPVMAAPHAGGAPSIRVEHPRNRGSRQAAQQQQAQQSVQPDLWQQEEEGDQPGFFQRMTARFTPREEQQPIRRTEVMGTRQSGTPAEHSSDYLEIPAFLRRQAN